ncbi:MAG: FHA domain-containing protein [Planctomycetes bacterium]|nr:FHA domain-containing protein [Planctomycetota bacterium]
MASRIQGCVGIVGFARNEMRSMPELLVKSTSGVRTYGMPIGKPMFIGRIVECEICLPSPAVSRRHAVVMFKGGVCAIKDLDSSNGTYLNGKKIDKTVRIRNGDTIRIGSFTLDMHFPEENASAAHAQPERHLHSRRSSRRKKAAALSTPGVGAEAQPMAAPVAQREGPYFSDDAAQQHAPGKAAGVGVDDGPEPEPETVSPEHAPPSRPEPEPEPVLNIVDERNTPTKTVDDIADTAQPAPAIQPKTLAVQPASIVAEPKAEQKTAVAEQQRHDDGKAGDDEQLSALDAEIVKAHTSIMEKEPLLKAMRETARDFVVPRIDPDSVADDDDSESADYADGDVSAASEESGSEEAEEAEAASAAKLDKAAAEAGIVGEFTPDVEETPQGQPAAPVQAQEDDAGTVPISEEFRRVIETRLNLYSFLADLAEERKQFIAKRPKMSDSVKAELARQDREMTKMPTAEKAAGMIEKRQAKRQDTFERIKKARETGEPGPPKPTRSMIEAEDIATNQWTLIIQSEREALPAVVEEGYKLYQGEPLAEELTRAGIEHKFMLGGGAYYLALEKMVEEAKAERQRVKAEAGKMSDAVGKQSKGFFNRSQPDPNIQAEVESKMQQAAEIDNYLASRAVWLEQERSELEKKLIQDFWRVYEEVALKYIPQDESTPMAVRAFLRHGAIGFQPWWMNEQIRNHVVRDCTEDVVLELKISKEINNIVYADEYLSAVAKLNITPALDENLEINERNSPNWKADKALRRLINSVSQKTLLEELIGDLENRVEAANKETEKLDVKIGKLMHGSKNYKQVKNELQQKRQSFKVEAAKLGKVAEKIKDTTIPGLNENIADVNEKFESGELPRPAANSLSAANAALSTRSPGFWPI